MRDTGQIATESRELAACDNCRTWSPRVPLPPAKRPSARSCKRNSVHGARFSAGTARVSLWRSSTFVSAFGSCTDCCWRSPLDELKLS